MCERRRLRVTAGLAGGLRGCSGNLESSESRVRTVVDILARPESARFSYQGRCFSFVKRWLMTDL